MSATALQTLWVGSQLKPLHTEALKSFVKYHHQVELYCYEFVEAVPEGVVIKDAADILPKENIFQYKKGPGKGSFSAFSNVFRYALLFKKGGIWIDTDVFCLAEWNFDSVPYVFASETLTTETDRITASCVIKTPPQSPVMKYCWEESLKISPDHLEWGQIGPKLLNQAVQRFGLASYIRPSWEFCALGWDETDLLTDPQSLWRPPQKALGLHLNHEMLRRSHRDFDEQLLSKLKKWT
jgi:hypothetical protein